MELNCICVVGWSGSGKTTLIENLLKELSLRKITAAALKHSSDPHPLHRRGSDSDRLSASGAEWVGFATPDGLQLSFKGSSQANLKRLAPVIHELAKIVLIEGWKDGPYPKIEVLRPDLGPALYLEDPSVAAVVSETDPSGCRLPVFRRDEIVKLADWILLHALPL